VPAPSPQPLSHKWERGSFKEKEKIKTSVILDRIRGTGRDRPGLTDNGTFPVVMDGIGFARIAGGESPAEGRRRALIGRGPGCRRRAADIDLSAQCATAVNVPDLKRDLGVIGIDPPVVDTACGEMHPHIVDGTGRTATGQGEGEITSRHARIRGIEVGQLLIGQGQRIAAERGAGDDGGAGDLINLAGDGDIDLCPYGGTGEQAGQGKQGADGGELHMGISCGGGVERGLPRLINEPFSHLWEKAGVRVEKGTAKTYLLILDGDGHTGLDIAGSQIIL